MSSDILRLRKVNKSFPGVKALTDMDFTLKKGEVHALVGENGAGKSTLMKILSGAYKKDCGTIEFDGKEVDISSPKQAEELGIAIIYQELNLFRQMTIAENVFVGRQPKKCGLIQWEKMNRDAKVLFDKFGVEVDVTKLVHSISMGQQQIVEIVKAISNEAKVVIMDEPTSSLSMQETKLLFKVICTLKEAGTSIVFITHRLDEIYEICDRMTVLRDGCYIGTHNVKDVSKEDMIAMMIGRQLTRQFPEREERKGDVLLEVRNLSDEQQRVKDVSFKVHAGEVLGIGGLVGAGRTETARLIFGADKKTSGDILIDGKKVNIKNPRDAIKNGIGFLTENRKEEGLFLQTSIRANTVIVSLKKLLRPNRIFLDLKKEKTVAEEYSKALRVVSPSINKQVMYLSGGNQQKVVLSKWLFADSQIVIFDEPTRGIDVGAKYEIYEIINKLAEKGKAVIVISSDMEEIIGICSRVLIMHEGKITGEIEKEKFSQKTFMQCAVGEKMK